ncbi:LamG-like jellyroll fold domain-containing protein [Cellulomonas sp.]|uniref:LamG-like jellyroll fold domain-containing protein n=1 Tax=Cellulomonas sp. TaxID=40001 RepID=UPI003BA931E8
MRLDVSTGAVRTRVSGAWAKVDNSVVAKGGALRVASAVTPMRFSDGSGDEPFATIERDGHELSFDMPFDLPAPTVEGAQLTFANVLPGVDLVVTVNEDATGFSEVLRVQSPEAAADPRLKDLTFPIETSDEIELQAQDGGFIAADGAGETVFTSPTPVMWDSSGVEVPPGKVDRALGPEAALPDPAVEPVGGEDLGAIPAEVAVDEVTLTPDAGMLTDSATVWPVFIDPGMSGSLNRRSAVRTEYGIKYDFLGDEGVGLCSSAASSTCPKTFMSRLLYQFAGVQGLGDMDPSDVVSATFAVTGTHSNSCTPQPVTLYAVADFDQNTAYPGGGYWSPLQTLTIAHRADCPAGQEPRRIEFNATAHAKAVATANTGLVSFGIAANEDSMAYWKRYGWDASFSVVYNRAPSAPVNARLTGPDAVCTTGTGRPSVRSLTPTLRAALSDPDGGNVHGSFGLDDLTLGTRLWTPGLTAGQGSGSEHAVTVPGDVVLQHGHVYRFVVGGHDGSRPGPLAMCEFLLDLEAPVAPGVIAAAGHPAVYAESATNGGVGVAGLFTFSPGASVDVAFYRYRLNGGEVKTTPASSPTVTIVPSLVGPQALTVESVDAAGGVSPDRTYLFTVALATVSAAWQLDHVNAGTTLDTTNANYRRLTVSSGVTLVNGPGRELGNKQPGDYALRFDALDDAASTSQPIVATDATFSVMAFVKLEDVDGTYTAVSQDGGQVSGFELGHRVDASCPDGTGGHCWAFWMPGSDAAGAPVAVMSKTPARVGSWVQLTGVRNASDGTLKLAVCELGNPQPKFEDSRLAPTAWSASGAFQVGRGRAGGAPARAWHGAISHVRTYTGAIVAENLRTSCSGPWNVMPALDPAPVPVPGPLPTPAIAPGTFWRIPGGNIYQIAGNAKYLLSQAEWNALGSPGYQEVAASALDPLTAVPTSHLILRTPDGKVFQTLGGSKIELTYGEWLDLGRPAAVNVPTGFVALIGTGTPSGQWFVRDALTTGIYQTIGGAIHLLTAAEWAAVGPASYVHVPTRFLSRFGSGAPSGQWFLRNPATGLIVQVVGGVKYELTAADYASLGSPAAHPTAAGFITRIGTGVPAGHWYLRNPTTGEICDVNNGTKRSLTFAEWVALPSPTYVNIPAAWLASIPNR